MRWAIAILLILLLALSLARDRALNLSERRTLGNTEHSGRRHAERDQHDQVGQTNGDRQWYLRVTVRSPAGVRVCGARVAFQGAPRREECDHARTNEKGAVRIQASGAGTLRVTDVAPYYPFSVAVYPREGEASRRIDVRLSAGELSICGRVVDVDGRLASARVQVLPEGSRQPVGTAQIVPNGFRVAGLRAGVHRVVAQLDGRGTTGQVPLRPIFADAGEEDVVIRLVRAGPVRIPLYDLVTGDRIDENQWVQVLENTESPRISVADFMPMPPILWLEEREDIVLRAGADGYVTSGTISWRVSHDGEPPRIELRPDPESWVDVVVSLADLRGNPIQAVAWWRESKDGGRLWTLLESVSGIYQLRLPAGSHWIALEPFGTKKSPSSLLPREWRAELKRKTTVRRAFVFESGGFLQKPQRDGKDVAVELHRLADSGHASELFWNERWPRLLPVGRYRVRTKSNPAQSEVIEVDAGRTSKVEFRKERG